MIHTSRPIFSTQFHPEAKGGPLDSSFLFDIYLDSVLKYKKTQEAFQPHRDNRPSPLLADILGRERVGVDAGYNRNGSSERASESAPAAVET